MENRMHGVQPQLRRRLCRFPISPVEARDGQFGNGTGGSKYPDLPAEFSKVPFKRGIVGMARKGGDNNSANSQFFIMYADGAFLNGQYTVVGEVLSGIDAVDKIKKGEPVADPDRMTRVQVAADAK